MSTRGEREGWYEMGGDGDVRRGGERGRRGGGGRVRGEERRKKRASYLPVV